MYFTIDICCWYYFQLSIVESKSSLSAMKQLCENLYDDFDVELTNNLV